MKSQIQSFPAEVRISRVNMFPDKARALLFILLCTEMLQAVRVLKFNAWEGFFRNQVHDLRTLEARPALRWICIL